MTILFQQEVRLILTALFLYLEFRLFDDWLKPQISLSFLIRQDHQ